MSAFDVRRIALKATAADVLSRHGITVDDSKLYRIAFDLWMASDPGAARTQIQRWEKREHAARRKRIVKLDAVIAAYRERVESLGRIEREGSLLEASYLSSDHVRDLRQMMRNLKSVRETEAAFIADRKHARARPTGAKNAYAAQIYRRGLRGSGFNRNQKCLVIADLLIAAGVDHRPRRRGSRGTRDDGAEGGAM